VGGFQVGGAGGWVVQMGGSLQVVVLSK